MQDVVELIKVLFRLQPKLQKDSIVKPHVVSLLSEGAVIMSADWVALPCPSNMFMQFVVLKMGIAEAAGGQGQAHADGHPIIPLELQFLNLEADTVLAAGVRDDVLEALPEPGPIMKPHDALVKLEQLKLMHGTMAFGPKLESEVTGVISMVQDIAQGLCPTRSMSTSTMTPYLIACLKRMENFCICHETVSTTKGMLYYLVFGSRALDLYYRDMEASVKEDGFHSISLKDVAVFRTFRWMLSFEQQTETDKWIEAILRNNEAPQGPKALTDAMMQ